MRTKILPLSIIVATLIDSVAAVPPTATADNGVFVGVTTSVPNSTYTANKFLGMPFAVTPPERYAPPVPAPNSTETRQATKYAPGCVQLKNATILAGTLNDTSSLPENSEDCLYINVYTPGNATSSSKLAVLFWVYGGSFSNGYASIPTYDGTNLAALQNVVVVSANYRLNIFGYPGPTPGLPAEYQNLGILDIKLALDWTRRNIQYFGGDPDKVTLFGESAGSINIDYIHLSTPSTNAPFRAVILESGSYYLGAFGYGVLTNTSNSSSTSGQAVSRSLGCNWDNTTIACMKNKTVPEIKTAIDAVQRLWGPTPDNGVNVMANWNGQKYRNLFGARIPVLLGTNADEGMLFLSKPNTSTFEYMFEVRFPELKPYEKQIKAAYPIGRCSITGCWANETQAVSQVMTDYMFTCLAAREARGLVHAGAPTWRYRYNTTSGGVDQQFLTTVPHAFEIPQIFKTYDPAVATENQVSVSRVIQKAWADFAKDPFKGPGWPAYNDTYQSKVAQFGGPKSPGGVSLLSLGEVDAYCGIYDALYDLKDPPR